jgi:pSer/pThr/pTyr-binding forkhead associated (FHA) protein
MHVVLQGTMRIFSARELLRLFGGRAHSGTFHAESGEKRVRLFFREGRVEWAEGNGGNDPQSIVTDLVSWSDGTFTFLDATELPEGATPLALDVIALVEEAERRVAEASKMQQLFPDEQTVFRIVPKPEGDISLKPEEFQILFRIGSGRSLAQLRNDTKLPVLDLYPMVHKLQSRGLIEVSDEGAPRTPPPKSVARKKATIEKATSIVTPLPKKTTTSHKKPRIATLTSDEGTMHPLLDDDCSIGRTGGNSIVLGDGSVSSRHAKVARSGDGFVVTDLGSRNGTFVNGERVTEPKALTDGDTVRFGKVVLTFNIAAQTRPPEATDPEFNRRDAARK